MSFRDRMKKRGGSRRLQKRHNAGSKSPGGRFPTIFNKDKIPEGVQFWRCTEGDHIIDILPFECGPDMPYNENDEPITEEGGFDYVIDLFVHMNVGSMNKPFVCPYENFGKECPICEYMKANRLEKEDWKKLFAKHRDIYLVWVHDSPEEKRKGVQIMESAHFFMGEKIEEIAKLPEEGGYINFSDPDEGKRLAWRRKGSGRENTQYLGHRFIDRPGPLPEKLLDKTFALDQVINMHPSYEEIEKEFQGTLKKMNLIEDDDGNEEYTGAGGEDDIDDSYWDDEPKEEKKKPPQRKKPTQRKRKPSESTGSGSSAKPKRKRRRK